MELMVVPRDIRCRSCLRAAGDTEIGRYDGSKPLFYYPGRSVTGIFVVPLDPNDLTRVAGTPRHLFAFNKDHIWERYGEMNKYTDVA
jgi:xylan 1,4-beta-xylosidase